MSNRKFTTEEKLTLLKEAREKGVTSTLEKHGIYRATCYAWKKKFESMGVEGFERGMTPEHQKRIRVLEKENKLLKELIAEKELEGKLKDELLKKKFALEIKNSL